MDQDYNNHKKFWDHIRKITPTWKGRDEKDTKRRARSDGKEGDENEEGKDDNDEIHEEKNEDGNNEW